MLHTTAVSLKTPSCHQCAAVPAADARLRCCHTAAVVLQDPKPQGHSCAPLLQVAPGTQEKLPHGGQPGSQVAGSGRALCAGRAGTRKGRAPEAPARGVAAGSHPLLLFAQAAALGSPLLRCAHQGTPDQRPLGILCGAHELPGAECLLHRCAVGFCWARPSAQAAALGVIKAALCTWAASGVLGLQRLRLCLWQPEVRGTARSWLTPSAPWPARRR